MSEQHVTFVADGENELNNHSGRYSQLTIGKVGKQDFGDGQLFVQKRTLDNGLHTIRTITAAQFLAMANKTVRLELPNGTLIVVTLSGSTNPNLYVEHRNQQDIGKD